MIRKKNAARKAEEGRIAAQKADFEIKDGVLVKYIGKGGDVVISAGVTSIGYSAFSGCSCLTSVVIPDSVTSIGEYAFCCSGLSKVTMPIGFKGKVKKIFDEQAKKIEFTFPGGKEGFFKRLFRR